MNSCMLYALYMQRAAASLHITYLVSIAYTYYEVPLRDVGDAKSRGRRKLKGGTQVTQVVKNLSWWKQRSVGCSIIVQHGTDIAVQYY